MYYIKQDNEIVLKDNNLQTITFSRDNAYPKYKELPILETNKDIIEFEGRFYLEDDEYYLAESLKKAKKAKLNEALQKAYLFQQEGTVEYKNCLFEMSDSNRKNLSDTEEALKLMGEESAVWSDKDDNLVTLTLEDIQYIRLNLILARIQKLWIEQYPSYKSQIEQKTTIEDVNKIVIDYRSEE